MGISKTWEIAFEVIPLVGAVLSCAASAYMLRLFMRMPRPSRQRMLLRQLLYLSLANLVYSLAQVVEEALELAVLGGWRANSIPKTTLKYACIAIAAPGYFGAVASMLCECHLAFAFTATILRYGGTLEHLPCLLEFVWPLAFVLAAGDVVSVSGKHGYFWDADLVGCTEEKGNLVDVWFMSITVAFSVACYVVGSCGVCRAGEAVQQRVWRRAQTYPLMAVITLVPTLVYQVVPVAWLHNHESMNYLSYIGATLTRNLSGVIYFAFYSLNTRYVRQAFRDSDVSMDEADSDSKQDGKEHSFRVNFRGEASVLEFQESGLRTPSSVGSSAPTVIEVEQKNLLISYYMNSWSGLNGGAGRRWGAVDEQPDLLLASRSPMNSTLRSDLSSSR